MHHQLCIHAFRSHMNKQNQSQVSWRPGRIFKPLSCPNWRFYTNCRNPDSRVGYNLGDWLLVSNRNQRISLVVMASSPRFMMIHFCLKSSRPLKFYCMSLLSYRRRVSSVPTFVILVSTLSISKWVRTIILLITVE